MAVYMQFFLPFRWLHNERNSTIRVCKEFANTETNEKEKEKKMFLFLQAQLKTDVLLT